MRFSELVGHNELKKRLIQSVQEERVPHAQIFHGPEGTGSLALALAFATYLSCEDKKEGDSCGLCPSCIKYDKLIHPDLHFVYPVFTTKSSGSNPVSDDFIETWRTSLLENPYMTIQQWYMNMGLENKQGIINKFESEKIHLKLSLKAFESSHKVMIMWMPEKMNSQAASRLLKLIEEPPPMTVFLLVAEDTRQILPTILSRTQHIYVPRLSDAELLEALKNTFPGEDIEKLKHAAHLAAGNYNAAIENLGMSEDFQYHFELFIKIMRLAYGRNFQEIFDWVEEVAGLGRERQKAFLIYAIRMVRENYLISLNTSELSRMSPPETEFSEKFSRFIHDGNAPIISKELNEACIHIEANGYSRIIFLDFALKLVKLIR